MENAAQECPLEILINLKCYIYRFQKDQLSIQQQGMPTITTEGYKHLEKGSCMCFGFKLNIRRSDGESIGQYWVYVSSCESPRSRHSDTV